MGFIFICAIHIVSLVICWIFINAKWSYYTTFSGRFSLSILRSHNLSTQIWADDHRFLSLKFSALRHTLIPLAFSALIWYVNIGWLNSTLTALALFYVFPVCSRYRVRRADYSVNPDRQSALKPAKSACFSIVVLSVINYIILMACYALRP